MCLQHKKRKKAMGFCTLGADFILVGSFIGTLLESIKTGALRGWAR